MKEYLIGRGNDSDIVIPDESDQVSRHHVYLRIGFWGKMMMKDVSNNGTFANDVPLKKSEWERVSRKEHISLAKVWDLDWNTIPHPYRVTKIVLSVLIVLLLAGGGTAGYLYQDELGKWLGLKKEKKADSADIAEEKADSTKVDSTNTPKDSVAATQPVETKKTQKKTSKKKNNVTIKKDDPQLPEEDDTMNPSKRDKGIRSGEIIM